MKDEDKTKEQLLEELQGLRRQTQEELSRSYALFSRIMETSPAGIVVLDRNGVILTANTQAARVLGLSAKQISGLTYNDPQWRITDFQGQPFPDDKLPFRQVMVTGQPVYDVEHAIEGHLGQRVLLTVNATPLLDESGRVERVVATVEDITQRVKIKRALQQSRKEWEEIFQAIGQATVILNIDHTIIAANRAAVSTINKPEKEIIGRKCYEFFHGSHQPAAGCPMEKLLASSVIETVEMEMETLKGVFLVSCTPILDERDNIKGIIHIATDITERRRSEEALRRSEEKYRLLVNQIPAVVYKGYKDWSLDCFDRKIEEITGYAKEDFDSRRITLLELIFPEDIETAKNLFKEAMKGDGSFETELRIRKKSGEVCWIQARNRIIYNADGKFDYISGVFFDITARKKLEDQLIKVQRMEAVGILAGGMAHDFNNLLTAIMGYGEIMLMDLRPEDPYCLYVEEIKKAAHRGASLTNQLLAFSRKQILQPQVINLNDVVIDMDKMLRRLIGEDIDLVTRIDQNLGLVKADPGQIEQILMNLTVNARDAMLHGGQLTIETANVSLDQDYARSHMDVAPGLYVMLAVSDNGRGMDGKTMSHIFEPFFSTKDIGKGTGLGLATVYGIVKQSGGHIWVHSEPEQGTTFKVYLPRVEKGLDLVRPNTAMVTTLEGDETILLVEDDTGLRELISAALRKYGFTVLEAAHGGEALMICESQKAPIHLMLTDVVMPQISGSALAERLQPLHPEMKVLYMSGYTEDAIVHHGVLNPEINFIQKPFKVLSLVRKVREVLDSPEGAEVLN